MQRALLSPIDDISENAQLGCCFFFWTPLHTRAYIYIYIVRKYVYTYTYIRHILTSYDKISNVYIYIFMLHNIYLHSRIRVLFRQGEISRAYKPLAGDFDRFPAASKDDRICRAHALSHVCVCVCVKRCTICTIYIWDSFNNSIAELFF